MQSSSKEQEVHKVANKFHEQSLLKQGAVDEEDSGDTTSSAGENRYPGWPGTSVFRMLIPSHKVGAIIGHKGERVRRLCEETKACVRIIGGQLCAAEQAVSCPLHSYLVIDLKFPSFPSMTLSNFHFLLIL